MRINIFVRYLLFPFLLLMGSAHADNSLEQLSGKFDKLDKMDFDDAMAKAEACLHKRDFSCTDSQLAQAKKYAHSQADADMVSALNRNLSAKRSAYAEEQRRLAELRRQEEEILRRQQEMERQAAREEREREQEEEDRSNAEIWNTAIDVINQSNQMRQQSINQHNQQVRERNRQLLAQQQAALQQQQRQNQQQHEMLQRQQQEQQQRRQQEYERQQQEQQRQRQQQEQQRKQEQAKAARADHCVEWIREKQKSGGIWLYARNGCGRDIEVVFCTSAPGTDYECGRGSGGGASTVRAGSRALQSDNTRTSSAPVNFRACFQPYTPSFQRAEGCW